MKIYVIIVGLIFTVNFLITFLEMFEAEMTTKARRVNTATLVASGSLAFTAIYLTVTNW